MSSAWTVLSLLVIAAPPREAVFVQVSPRGCELAEAGRTPGRQRAVVLIHGLGLHPFHAGNVDRAGLHDWQRPDSLVVKRLGRTSDVFAFAYAQNGSADEVSADPLLAAGVRRLRGLGYHSVVLVGHSAGGLVARYFAEDDPDAGVTKVVQVCAPNGGSPWAQWPVVPPRQADFLDSLSKPVRRLAQAGRGDRQIPPHVEFACVVANGLLVGDGLVGVRCQWTDDLQRQGIPVYALATTHWQAVRTRTGADLIADLVGSPLPRWDAGRVAAVRRSLLGEAGGKTP